MYDTQVAGGRSKFKQVDRERSLQALMTTNLLKRLESSIESFRLTLQSLRANHTNTLTKISAFNQTGVVASIDDLTDQIENLDAEDDDLPAIGDGEIGGKVKINPWR